MSQQSTEAIVSNGAEAQDCGHQKSFSLAIDGIVTAILTDLICDPPFLNAAYLRPVGSLQHEEGETYGSTTDPITISCGSLQHEEGETYGSTTDPITISCLHCVGNPVGRCQSFERIGLLPNDVVQVADVRVGMTVVDAVDGAVVAAVDDPLLLLLALFCCFVVLLSQFCGSSSSWKRSTTIEGIRTHRCQRNDDNGITNQESNQPNQCPHTLKSFDNPKIPSSFQTTDIRQSDGMRRQR